MALKIEWTLEAKNQFSEVLEYWNIRNGTNVYSNKLIDLFDQSIKRLAQHPEIGRPTDNRRIRLKIIKDYFLYYSFTDTELSILGVSDMKRDPNYLKTLIE